MRSTPVGIAPLVRLKGANTRHDKVTNVAKPTGTSSSAASARLKNRQTLAYRDQIRLLARYTPTMTVTVSANCSRSAGGTTPSKRLRYANQNAAAVIAAS